MAGHAELFVFLCPKCYRPLEEGRGSYVCREGHTFDRARSGYVNLLQRGDRGDTRAMLSARRTFLERGFFQPISDAINDRVVENLERLRDANRLRGDEVIVDAGCGEGYYLRRLIQRLQQTETFGQMRIVGLDASRDAVRLTASQVRGHPCAVVDIAGGLHLRPGCAPVLLNVFAPRNPAAFAEALMPEGLCLVVMPRTEHMQELRVLMPLLTIPPEKQDRIVEQFRPHLTLTRREDLDYTVRLDAAAVRAWVEMGPNAWHLTPDQIAAIRVPDAIAVTVACTVMSFEKAGTSVARRGGSTSGVTP